VQLCCVKAIMRSQQEGNKVVTWAGISTGTLPQNECVSITCIFESRHCGTKQDIRKKPFYIANVVTCAVVGHFESTQVPGRWEACVGSLAEPKSFNMLTHKHFVSHFAL